MKKSRLVLSVFLFCVIFWGFWRLSYAVVPRLFSYQGRLTDKDGKALEGAYDLTIRLYDAETAGNLLWEEAHQGVVIQQGVFNILLGSVKELSLAFDKQYFLEVKAGEEVMKQRQRMTSLGYVYRAEFTENDLPKGAIIMWSGSISSIPKGWALCDGANGTPDLRDRFVVGARADENGAARTNVSRILSQIGGVAEVGLTIDNLPKHRHLNLAHTHTGPIHTHKGSLHQHIQTEHTHLIGKQYTVMGSQGGPGGFPAAWMGGRKEHVIAKGGGGMLVSAAGVGETTLSGAGETSSTGIYTSDEGSGAAQSNLPPYYALAYIMKL